MLTCLAFYCVRSTLLFVWYTIIIITLGKRQKSVFQISKPGGPDRWNGLLPRSLSKWWDWENPCLLGYLNIHQKSIGMTVVWGLRTVFPKHRIGCEILKPPYSGEAAFPQDELGVVEQKAPWSSFLLLWRPVDQTLLSFCGLLHLGPIG